jgi:hypothetical protein
MPAYLVFIGGPRHGAYLTLDEGQSVLCGRAEECPVRTGSDQASRRHCQISLQADMLVVEDLGSRNGTFVNGHRVTRVRTGAGDRIAFADVVLEVRLPTAAPAPAYPPPPAAAVPAPASPPRPAAAPEPSFPPQPSSPPPARKGRCGCIIGWLLAAVLAAAGGVLLWMYWDEVTAWTASQGLRLPGGGGYAVPAFEDLFEATRYDPPIDLLATGPAGADRSSPEAVVRALAAAQRGKDWPAFKELLADMPARLARSGLDEEAYRAAMLQAWAAETGWTEIRVTHRVKYLDRVLLVQEMAAADGARARRLIELREENGAWRLSDDLPPGDPVLHRLSDPDYAIP